MKNDGWGETQITAADEELVDKVVQGSRDSFSLLIDRYQGKVFRTVIGMVGSYSDAEDLTQEVFIRAYRNIRTFRKDSKFSSWIYRIAINASKNYNNRQRVVRFFSLDREHKHPEDCLEQQWVNKEEIEKVYRCLGELPSIFREVLVLKEVEGLDYQEISKIVGIEMGTVKSRISRAKEKLRLKWSEDQG